MGLLDYNKIKKDFPIFERDMNGKRFVFLDTAASSQSPLSVIDSYAHYYKRQHANIHRGAYILSYEATELYDLTREKVAKWVHAPRAESIVFTRNTTESINLVAYSWGLKNLSPGDEILVSEMEHHANLVPWMMIAEKTGAKLTHLPLTDDFKYDYNRIDEVLTERTKIVSLSHASNSTGTIHDMERIGQRLKDHRAIFVVDGAQGAPHLPIDVQKIGCDFYAFSAHKMLGPTGVGVLYGRLDLLKEMDPFLGGGDMILNVWKDGFKSAPVPDKFEAGTPNIAGVVAFKSALDYLEQIGLDRIHEHESILLEQALEQLKKIDSVTLYGTDDLSSRGGIISFNFADIHPHDVGGVLDSEGVAVRAGHHCNEPLMRKLNLETGTVRASFYIYNGPEDVEALVQSVQKVQEVFKSVLK